MSKITSDATEEQAKELSAFVAEVNEFVKMIREKYPKTEDKQTAFVIMAFEQLTDNKIISVASVDGKDKILVPGVVCLMTGNKSLSGLICKSHSLYHQLTGSQMISDFIDSLFKGDIEVSKDDADPKKPVDPTVN